MKLPDHAVEAVLERQPVARLATLGPDGQPHLVPVVFVRHEGVLWTPVDAKPKGAGELRRVRNVRANPRATLLLDAYDADWSRLWWVRVEGAASVVEQSRADPGAGIEAVADALQQKYPQYGPDLGVFRDRPVLLCLTIERVASWCTGPAAIPPAPDPGSPAAC